MSKKRSKRWLATLSACCLAALLLEGLCWGLREVLLPNKRKWARNAKTGRLVQGFRGAVAQADDVAVNSLALRGPEPKLSPTRSPNRLRIYCLGNSTTFGWGASTDADTYPAQLEKILKARYPDYELEVINAGVPGNSSQVELQLLKEDLPRLHPDVVILWSGWPDWTYYLKPEVRKRARDPLSLLKKSNTFFLVSSVRDSLTPQSHLPVFKALDTRSGSTKFGLSVLSAWRKNIDAMIDSCAQEKASVIVLGFPSPLRRPVDSWNEQTRLESSHLAAIQGIAPADVPKSIQDFEHELKVASERNERVTDAMYGKLSYIPAENLPEQPELFSDGVHMTNAGYAALAEAVATQLERMLKSKR